MTLADDPSDDPLLAAALAWHGAGYSVVPTHEDRGKRPFGAWKQYQAARPTTGELTRWLSTGRYTGIGVITGTVSGEVEMLEVEGRAVRAGAIDRLNDAAEHTGIGPLWARVMRGCIEQSPSGGLHLFVRVTDGAAKPNTKLARTVDPDTGEIAVLAETRGAGGFVVVAPSSGRDGHPDGSSYTFLLQSRPEATATITAAERDDLHHLLAILDEMPDGPADEPAAPRTGRTGTSPGDDYNARTDWGDILGPAGWTLVHHGTRGGHPVRYWRRPGKDAGISASTGGPGDHLWVFTTSTTLPTEKPLTKFYVRAHLDHGGDMAAAARSLAAEGYGDPMPAREPLRAWNGPHGAGAPGGSDRLPEEFWAAHGRLAAVREAAHARGTSADAVLGAVLAHTCARLPHYWVLPPVVGGRVAVNLAVALVGPPGTGKGSAQKVARELLGPAPRTLAEVPLGSGEGLVQAYFEWVPDPDKKAGKVLARVRDNVLVVDDEGSVLTALLRRSGETAVSTLLKAWIGERMGFTYSKRSQPQPETTVAELTYRWAMLVGIQPDAAGTLLDAAGVGLPQRFVWLPTVDPGIPAPGQRPAWPDVQAWEQPDHGTGFSSPAGTYDVTVDDDIVHELAHDHHARVTGAGEVTMDAHRGLARLKVAAILAAWTRPGAPLAVRDDDWALAGMVLDASDATRDQMTRWLAGRAEEAVEAKARVAARVAAAGDRITAAAKIVHQHVDKPHDRGYCTRGCVNRATGSRHRGFLDQAIDRALANGWIVDIGDDVPHYRPGGSVPR